jgi:hypothetical protein
VVSRDIIISIADRTEKSELKEYDWPMICTVDRIASVSGGKAAHPGFS